MTIDRVQTTPIDLTDHHCQAGVDPTTLQLQLGEQHGEFTHIATRQVETLTLSIHRHNEHMYDTRQPV
ncbi:unannotated protein [freshwater metagenome]|uniref:Unannotated protein n=1 Tax=freshwater metagenome TaxID=449393 RepID=A0A6J7ET18_9ZZZZ|nr:hypothetical protein [Actinomycetota bacterium]